MPAELREMSFNKQGHQHLQFFALNWIYKLCLKKASRILLCGKQAFMMLDDLLRKGFDVTGTDVSKELVEFTRQRFSKVTLGVTPTFHVCSVEDLDFAKNEFDLIVALDVIEHLRQDRWALRVMHRALKPGGYLIVTGPNTRLSTLNEGTWMKNTIKIIAKGFLRNLFTLSSLKRKLTGLDFEVLNSVSRGLGPFKQLNRSNRLSLILYWTLQKYSERKIVLFLSELGSNLIVLCQKKKLLSGINKRPIFIESDRQIEVFISEKNELFSQRNDWLRENPEYYHLNPQRLDTQTYSNENVLVISPHPDDEIVGCGGTLIKMLNEGSFVTVLQLTDGSNTCALKDYPEHIRKTIRLEEAKNVAENLQFAELILWKEKDSQLKCTTENVRKLVDILERIRPKVIFVPFLNDPHPDHAMANEILRRALEVSSHNLPEVDVLSYEVWSFVPPNSYCIIDNQFDKKAQMLMKYRTGMKAVDYVHECESLNSYNKYIFLNKKGFAEAFFTLNAKAYVKLIKGENNR